MSQKYTLANGANMYTQEGSTEFKIADSSGLLFSEEKPIFMPSSTKVNPYYVETISLTSVGATPSTITAYGNTVINPNTTGGDFSSSPRVFTMAAPITGVKKSIIFNTTAAAINTVDIDLTAACGVQNVVSSTNRYIAFSSLANHPQVVNLVGVSTSVWQVLSVESTIGQFEQTTNGIRAQTAVRTS